MSRLALFMCFACATTPAAAQVSCGPADHACYDDAVIAACNVQVADVQKCLQFIEQIKAAAAAGSRAATLATGHAYYSLEHMTTDTAESAKYREQARSVYKLLVQRNGADSEALLALATATEDQSERIRLLREGLKHDPSEIYAAQLLASDLEGLGGEADLIEAGKWLQKAYTYQIWPNRWHLAARAMGDYDLAGADALQAELKEKVRVDVAKDGGLAALRKNPDPQQTSAVLSTLCYVPVISILGANVCFEGIERVLANIRKPADRDRQLQLADVVAAAIVESAENDSALSRADAQWQDKYRAWLDDLAARGLKSAALSYAYARVSTGSTRIAALEQAVQMAPQDGHAAMRLGIEYFETGRFDLALEQLRRARSLLPEMHDGTLDHYIQRAEAKLAR